MMQAFDSIRQQALRLFGIRLGDGYGILGVTLVDQTGAPVTISGGGGGGGGAVTVADGADVTQGAMADTAATTDTGTFSSQSLFKRLLQKTPALGAANTAASSPMTLASDDAQIGAKTTGSTLSAGGSGIIGWLSDAVTQLKALVVGIVVAAGENVMGKTVGVVATPSTTVTRPANTTAYASGQLLANSVTAGSVTALQFTATRLAAGSATIRRGRLSKTSVTTTVSAFRLHLFSASPLAPTNGDGGAFIPVGAANYLGALDFPSMIACTDGAAGNGVPVVGSDITFVLGSGTTIYGLIEARAAYVPTSGEVFTAVLEIFQN